MPPDFVPDKACRSRLYAKQSVARGPAPIIACVPSPASPRDESCPGAVCVTEAPPCRPVEPNRRRATSISVPSSPSKIREPEATTTPRELTQAGDDLTNSEQSPHEKRNGRTALAPPSPEAVNGTQPPALAAPTSPASESARLCRPPAPRSISPPKPRGRHC
jgi:hypothetical protein